MNIHYNVTTGQIMSYGSADHKDGEASHFAGCKILVIPNQDVDARSQRIDPATRRLVVKEVTDPDPFSVPENKLRIAKAAIASELTATDQYMVVDRPLTDQAREEWRVYRQALRDLKGDADAIVEAWPTRPDGQDATAFLRTQMKD